MQIGQQEKHRHKEKNENKQQKNYWLFQWFKNTKFEQDFYIERGKETSP